jgi:catecholate siderophore receptor
MPSWRGALVYKPLSVGSVYFSYGTSFNPSAETLALSAANANLPPEDNETFEFGTKWELLQERLTLRAAVFRTEKSNAREPDPNNPLLNVLAGKQRVDGVEFEAGGKLTEKWNISAGYAYLDGTVIESKAFPASVGAQLANAPRNTFSFWTTYELPWKLEIGGGGRFVDDRAASSTAPTDPVTGKMKKAPDYVVFDAMLKYHLTKNIDVQFNVYNLANAEYYDQIHPAHIVPGAGRSMVVTTSFKF